MAKRCMKCNQRFQNDTDVTIYRIVTKARTMNPNSMLSRLDAIVLCKMCDAMRTVTPTKYVEQEIG